MIIRSSHKNNIGETIEQVYFDSDDIAENLNEIDFGGSHGYCFCGNKMVLVNHPKQGWLPPGGGAEEGENYMQTTEREVREETNMKVIYQELIGYNIYTLPDKIVKQTRSMCIVEPYGEFVSDPDGDIMEIKLIDPADYKKNFDWGETGDRIMERALELKKEYDARTRLG